MRAGLPVRSPADDRMTAGKSNPVLSGGFPSGYTGREWELRFHPDPILKKKSREYDQYGADLQTFAERMFHFMKASRGIGLAAPQIGLSCRIITVHLKGIEKCLVNPRIQASGGRDETDIEGCLSIPDRLFEVGRATRIEILARNTLGKELLFEASGFAARVLQHEIDHLNGILICDRGTETFEED